MPSCHVITMHCPDCVLIGSFKVGPQKLSDNSRQPVSINKKIRKRLTARLSMGVWSSGSWVPGQEKDVPFYTYWRWINGLTVLESVNSFYSRQHLVERWKGEVFNITPIYQKMKAEYFMRSSLPFVRYFIFTSSFYYNVGNENHYTNLCRTCHWYGMFWLELHAWGLQLAQGVYNLCKGSIRCANVNNGSTKCGKDPQHMWRVHNALKESTSCAMGVQRAQKVCNVYNRPSMCTDSLQWPLNGYKMGSGCNVLIV